MKSGQSLFEVVMALSVISLIIFAVVILATNSIRNSSFSRDKTLAANYSQEGIEWLRGQRDAGWTAFYGNASAQGSTFCLNSEPITAMVSGSCISSSFISGTIFQREAILKTITIGTSQGVEATSKVKWTDSQGYHEVATVTDFSNFNAK